jgi:intracellular sulfur oxidation DsrE/DsrF family protein
MKGSAGGDVRWTAPDRDKLPRHADSASAYRGHRDYLRRSTMKTTLSGLFVVLVMALPGCAAAPPEPAASRDVKIAFDITDGNPQVLLAKLGIIEVTRKQLLEAGMAPHMVIAFRGDASYFTQTDAAMIKEADRPDAVKVAAKIKELKAANGVDGIEQCNLPLASRKLKRDAVMPEVKVVPNGWISLVAYQDRGYRYIVP